MLIECSIVIKSLTVYLDNMHIYQSGIVCLL